MIPSQIPQRAELGVGEDDKQMKRFNLFEVSEFQVRQNDEILVAKEHAFCLSPAIHNIVDPPDMGQLLLQLLLPSLLV